jgi:hypothetical protein
MTHTVRILYVAAAADIRSLDTLERHLSPLRNQGLIDEINPHRFLPGVEIERELSLAAAQADLCVALVSADMLADAQCMRLIVEAQREARDPGGAQVLPLLLRPSDWEHTDGDH